MMRGKKNSKQNQNTRNESREKERKPEQEEESTGLRGGRGPKAADDEADLGADRRREVGARW